MNAKQLRTWKNIVRSCKSCAFSSINVASEKRSDVILAADALVELVTPELADLLEQLAVGRLDGDKQIWQGDAQAAAHALADRIREALETTE